MDILGAIFIGVCIVLAAALLAGAIPFPTAMSIILSMLFWIGLIIVTAIIAVIVLLVVLFLG